MTSTPRPELHLDIVKLIIDELHDFRPDLKTCALVCRSWVSQSRFYLFPTIHLNRRNNVSSFLALCASPYSTIPLARVSNLTIVTDLLVEDEHKDKQRVQNSAVFDQLLTWRSPHDGKSIADMFRHLKTLSLDWTEWRPQSETAKSMLYSTFQTVTELKMQNILFETGDEFLGFLSSLTCLEILCLDGVGVRIPGKASTTQSNASSSRFHTIELRNLFPYHCVEAIRAITPCHSLKNLSVHGVNFSDMNANWSMAVGDLLVSAGPSLKSFGLCVQAVGRFRRLVDLGTDTSLQHIDFTENPNIRSITLDVDDSAYLVPFLERLTRSHYPPSLEKLHIPKLVPDLERRSTHVDYKRIDELLQHSYFSALGEFRCTQSVIHDIGDMPLHRDEENNFVVDEDTWLSWISEEMESKIEELKAKMPKLADKGILQVEEYFEEVSYPIQMLRRR
ncbi:hypothetical protein K435DRAFT_973731 [Dendrothele bispora CBS 962.96]|uniref:F-box domain-containing protein n=1 Tax=Dendrothele bispora (strain CBS 962.96) TaxID=1314807 RepID=A0A4S8KQG5_DENBC|nr:hypothetical protein K435DRAFT_973731 [Dendrothele bispora CBS 962.96]